MIRVGEVVVGVADHLDVCPNDHSCFFVDSSSVGKFYRVVSTHTDPSTGCYMLRFRGDRETSWCHGTFRKVVGGVIPALGRARVPEIA